MARKAVGEKIHIRRITTEAPFDLHALGDVNPVRPDLNFGNAENQLLTDNAGFQPVDPDCACTHPTKIQNKRNFVRNALERVLPRFDCPEFVVAFPDHLHFQPFRHDARLKDALDFQRKEYHEIQFLSLSEIGAPLDTLPLGLNLQVLDGGGVIEPIGTLPDPQWHPPIRKRLRIPEAFHLQAAHCRNITAKGSGKATRYHHQLR